MPNFTDAAQADAQASIGKGQIRRSRERPVSAPLFTNPSNEESLALSRAGAKNLIQGTRKKNKITRKSTNAKVQTALDAEVDKLLARQSTDAAN